MPNEGSYEASLKRSNAIREDLPLHPEKYCMLTGDRPTGRLHLGHYFGSIQHRVEYQNLGIQCYVLIADYQVITDRDTTEHIQDNVYNMVMDYLAAGIDPEKTPIFTHSAIPALNQLMLPFLSLVSEAELERNPTVKAEQEASGHELTGLLLTYPVHQACDILFCKGNVVPVGKDQLPHIEITRTIARRFNKRYAKVFPEPHGVLSDVIEVPGLDGRKMSKSYGNGIALSMTAEQTAKLIRKSPTDSDRNITFDPEGRPEVSALLTTAALCSGRSEAEIAAEIGDGAEVMFAPEFDLKGIKEKRIVVVPAGIETKPNARDYLEDRLKVQVGLLKKCTEDDIPALVREVVSTGRRFLHKWVAGVRCVKAECNPLYSPEHLRERRQFTGVVELTFLSVHRNEE